MARQATPHSRPVAIFFRQTQRAVLVLRNECQNLRNRRVFAGHRLHALETQRKYAGAMKQLLIERANQCEPLAGELAALHADDVEALERRVLAVDQTKWNHVAADATDATDHHLRSDPRELVHRRKPADKNEIANLAMAAQRRRGREDDVIADLAVVTDMAAIHEIA